jgi:hypothetical protein
MGRGEHGLVNDACACTVVACPRGVLAVISAHTTTKTQFRAKMRHVDILCNAAPTAV